MYDSVFSQSVSIVVEKIVCNMELLMRLLFLSWLAIQIEILSLLDRGSPSSQVKPPPRTKSSLSLPDHYQIPIELMKIEVPNQAHLRCCSGLLLQIHSDARGCASLCVWEWRGVGRTFEKINKFALDVSLDLNQQFHVHLSNRQTIDLAYLSYLKVTFYIDTFQ